jgi:general secretion pathway protein G
MLLRTPPKQRRQRRAAFTLMEMLVVVAIIVILAGLGGYYFLGQAEESRKSAAKVQVRTLTQAVETYNVQHQGVFPDSLEMLLQRDAEGMGPYLKSQEVLIDPWGRPYQYDVAGTRNNGLTPDIWSTGPPNNPIEIGNWPATTGIR